MALLLQQLKSAKQFASMTLTSLKKLSGLAVHVVLAAAFLYLVHLLTLPVGGIVFFSAIFTAAVAGFACAVVAFHALARLPQCFHWVRAKCFN